MGISGSTPSSTSFQQAQDQGHKAAGHGGGAGAAVPLEHVAVDGDGALPQLFQVHCRPGGPGPPGAGSPPTGGRASAWRCPGWLRSRLARGSMEYSAVTQPSPSGTWGGARSSTLAAAQHMGVAAADEAAALRKPVDAGEDLHRPQLVVCSSVYPSHRLLLSVRPRLAGGSLVSLWVYGHVLYRHDSRFSQIKALRRRPPGRRAGDRRSPPPGPRTSRGPPSPWRWPPPCRPWRCRPAWSGRCR